MALKQYKPKTQGQRQLINIDRKDLHKGKPFKKLAHGLNRKSGHNNQGRITSWHKGGGHKRLYREIDFKRDKRDMNAVVERLEYDPNRTGFIALVKYDDGEMRYIMAPDRLKAGDQVISAIKADIKLGNAMQIRNIPVGTIVHNLELKISKGGQLARSAGTYAQIMGRDGLYVIVKLSSGEMRLIHGECFASIGAVSNQDHSNKSDGKAGRSRWKGRRPHVRGVAMNPIDHPHGGGEGKTSGGRHPVTPWGKKTKGKKTRHNPRTDKFIIRRGKK